MERPVVAQAKWVRLRGAQDSHDEHVVGDSAGGIIPPV
jgi:hypothetical protein